MFSIFVKCQRFYSVSSKDADTCRPLVARWKSESQKNSTHTRHCGRTLARVPKEFNGQYCCQKSKSLRDFAINL